MAPSVVTLISLSFVAQVTYAKKFTNLKHAQEAVARARSRMHQKDSLFEKDALYEQFRLLSGDNDTSNTSATATATAPASPTAAPTPCTLEQICCDSFYTETDPCPQWTTEYGCDAVISETCEIPEMYAGMGLETMTVKEGCYEECGYIFPCDEDMCANACPDTGGDDDLEVYIATRCGNCEDPMACRPGEEGFPEEVYTRVVETEPPAVGGDGVASAAFSALLQQSTFVPAVAVAVATAMTI